jgi:hypothetical protein
VEEYSHTFSSIIGKKSPLLLCSDKQKMRLDLLPLLVVKTVLVKSSIQYFTIFSIYYYTMKIKNLDNMSRGCEDRKKLVTEIENTIINCGILTERREYTKEELHGRTIFSFTGSIGSTNTYIARIFVEPEGSMRCAVTTNNHAYNIENTYLFTTSGVLTTYTEGDKRAVFALDIHEVKQFLTVIRKNQERPSGGLAFAENIEENIGLLETESGVSPSILSLIQENQENATDVLSVDENNDSQTGKENAKKMTEQREAVTDSALQRVISSVRDRFSPILSRLGVLTSVATLVTAIGMVSGCANVPRDGGFSSGSLNGEPIRVEKILRNKRRLDMAIKVLDSGSDNLKDDETALLELTKLLEHAPDADQINRAWRKNNPDQAVSLIRAACEVFKIEVPDNKNINPVQSARVKDLQEKINEDSDLEMVDVDAGFYGRQVHAAVIEKVENEYTYQLNVYAKLLNPNIDDIEYMGDDDSGDDDSLESLQRILISLHLLAPDNDEVKNRENGDNTKLALKILRKWLSLEKDGNVADALRNKINALQSERKMDQSQYLTARSIAFLQNTFNVQNIIVQNYGDRRELVRVTITLDNGKKVRFDEDISEMLTSNGTSKINTNMFHKAIERKLRGIVFRAELEQRYPWLTFDNTKSGDILIIDEDNNELQLRLYVTQEGNLNIDYIGTEVTLRNVRSYQIHGLIDITLPTSENTLKKISGLYNVPNGVAEVISNNYYSLESLTENITEEDGSTIPHVMRINDTMFQKHNGYIYFNVDSDGNFWGRFDITNPDQDNTYKGHNYYVRYKEGNTITFSPGEKIKNLPFYKIEKEGDTNLYDAQGNKLSYNTETHIWTERTSMRYYKLDSGGALVECGKLGLTAEDVLQGISESVSQKDMDISLTLDGKNIMVTIDGKQYNVSYLLNGGFIKMGSIKNGKFEIIFHKEIKIPEEGVLGVLGEMKIAYKPTVLSKEDLQGKIKGIAIVKKYLQQLSEKSQIDVSYLDTVSHIMNNKRYYDIAMVNFTDLLEDMWKKANVSSMDETEKEKFYNLNLDLQKKIGTELTENIFQLPLQEKVKYFHSLVAIHEKPGNDTMRMARLILQLGSNIIQEYEKGKSSGSSTDLQESIRYVGNKMNSARSLIDKMNVNIQFRSFSQYVKAWKNRTDRSFKNLEKIRTLGNELENNSALTPTQQKSIKRVLATANAIFIQRIKPRVMK